MSQETKITPKKPAQAVPAINRLKFFGDPIFNEMEELTQRIAKRAYDLFRVRGTDGHELCDWLMAENEIMQPMPLELKDTGNEFVLNASVPGFEASELEIKVENTRVVIKGIHEASKEKKEDGKVIYTEKHARHVCRSFELPAAVNADKVEASLNNGVLELKLPKAAKPASIEIKQAKAS